MAANNPRKFEEKIAQHKLRQAQETKEFDMIMQEMSRVTAKVSSEKQTRNRYGGSLPDFNAAQNQTTRSDNLNDLALRHNMDIQVPHRDRVYHPRTRLMTSTSRRHADSASPYHFSPYLSPPQMDANWRRTNSDSSIYHNLTNPNASRRICASPDGNVDVGSLLAPKENMEDMKLNISKSNQPQQQQQQVFNYSSNNGSLPDLSNLHIPSPFSVGIDQDESQLYNPSLPQTNSNVFAAQPRRHTTGSSSKRQIYRPQPTPTLEHISPGFMFQQSNNTSNPASPTVASMYQAPMSPLANGPGYLHYSSQMGSPSMQVQQLEQMATIAENMRPPLNMHNGQLGQQNVPPSSPNTFLNMMTRSPGAMEDMRQKFQDYISSVPATPESSLASELGNAIGGLDSLPGYPNINSNSVSELTGLGLQPLDISDLQVLSGNNVTQAEVEELFKREGNNQQQLMH